VMEAGYSVVEAIGGSFTVKCKQVNLLEDGGFDYFDFDAENSLAVSVLPPVICFLHARSLLC